MKRYSKHLKQVSAFYFLSAFFYFCSSYPAQAREVSFEKDTSVPIVHINAAFKVGAVTDPPGKSGLTNFMGEMLIRGTQSRSKEQIDLALDQMGARLDVETRTEALIFRGAVLSKQLEPFLKLLSEILSQPSFPETEIKKLKSEITSALQEELGHDTTLAARRFNSFLFQNHPYGKPILGNMQEVRNYSKADIVSHYRRLLRDKTLLVVGSGDSSEDRISAWANQLAQSIPDTPLSGMDSKLVEKVKTPENGKVRRLQLVDKPDRTQTQIFLGQIGVKMQDKDFFPLYLGNYAFGGPSFAATLMEEIREKRGWSYGANSSFRFGLEPRSWHVHLFPATKDAPNALAYTIQLIEELQKQGITTSQYEFSKQSLVNRSGFMYNTPKKRVENKLIERTLDLPDGFMQSYGSQIEKVQFSEVNSALNKYLKPDQLAISVLCTARDLKSSLARAAGVAPEAVEILPYTQN